MLVSLETTVDLRAAGPSLAEYVEGKLDMRALKELVHGF
jgi:hypothetical protein